ncbi:hypothetical protein D3C78_1634610 [compost metagenome]
MGDRFLLHATFKKSYLGDQGLVYRHFTQCRYPYPHSNDVEHTLHDSGVTQHGAGACEHWRNSISNRKSFGNFHWHIRAQQLQSPLCADGLVSPCLAQIIFKPDSQGLDKLARDLVTGRGKQHE